MEGVTDPAFRAVMLALHEPENLGGSTTEFVRVVDHAVPRHILTENLGPVVSPIPVGLQLMGNDSVALAATAARVSETNARFIDLNFGCPAKGTLRGCAGAALLKEPATIERIVAAVRASSGSLPVSAKIRAGYEHARDVEQLARAVEAGGADGLTVHCRTRAEGYADAVDWSRIARAVSAVQIPVCGNGGVLAHADIARMRAETGCRYVMIGRAALANPWIFSGYNATRAEAFRFVRRYMQVMEERSAVARRHFSGRVKQLISFLHPNFLAEDERAALLHEQDVEVLVAKIEAAAR
jgi:tRNA-dihydrouridine synthase